MTNLWCPLPPYLTGKAITVLAGAKGGDGNITLNTRRQTTGAGINISSSGAGWVQMEIEL